LAQDAKTRGEHQAFDANEVVGRFEGTPLSGRWVFIAPKAERLLLQLTKAKKVVIDNQVVEQEQEIARFQDHTFITDDEGVARKIRAKKAFKLGRIIELAELAAKAKDKRVNDLAKQLEADPALAEAVSKRLSLGKAAVPTVRSKESKAKDVE
jgi:hypothetical protein